MEKISSNAVETLCVWQANRPGRFSSHFLNTCGLNGFEIEQQDVTWPVKCYLLRGLVQIKLFVKRLAKVFIFFLLWQLLTDLNACRRSSFTPDFSSFWKRTFKSFLQGKRFSLFQMSKSFGHRTFEPYKSWDRDFRAVPSSATVLLKGCSWSSFYWRTSFFGVFLRSCIGTWPFWWSLLRLPMVSRATAAVLLFFLFLGEKLLKMKNLSGSKDRGIPLVCCWYAPKWSVITVHQRLSREDPRELSHCYKDSTF